jgi:hypothetical protein
MRRRCLGRVTRRPALEEMFDPARHRPDFEPSGWNPIGMDKRAMRGHPFGLAVSAHDKRSLIALRSL